MYLNMVKSVIAHTFPCDHNRVLGCTDALIHCIELLAYPLEYSIVSGDAIPHLTPECCVNICPEWGNKLTIGWKQLWT